MKRNSFLLIGVIVCLSCSGKEGRPALTKGSNNNNSGEIVSLDSNNVIKVKNNNTNVDTTSYEFFKSLFRNSGKFVRNEIPSYLLEKFLNIKPENNPNDPKIYPNMILLSTEKFDGLLYTFSCPAGGACESTTLVIFTKKGEFISDFEYSSNYSDNEETEVLTSEVSEPLVISSILIKRKFDDEYRVINEEKVTSKHKIMDDGKIIKLEGESD